jgi:hypothetical protein
MRKFLYIGDWAKGEVVFRETDTAGLERVTAMPKDKPVEVSDQLAAKFAKNNHFVEVLVAEYQGGDCDGNDKARRAPPVAHLPGRKQKLRLKQVSVTERRVLIAQLLRNTPQNSNRNIAKTLGVSHPTEGTVRAELEASGELEKITSCIGSDGRERPRRARGHP